jgi:hypothetical protein
MYLQHQRRATDQVPRYLMYFLVDKITNHMFFFLMIEDYSISCCTITKNDSNNTLPPPNERKLTTITYVRTATTNSQSKISGSEVTSTKYQ